MLNRKPSVLADDPMGGGPLFTAPGMPSVFAPVPPTSDAGWDPSDREPEACRLVSVNLSAYLDNELDPDQAQLIANHLGTCAGCAALLDAMEEADEAIQREWREDTPLPSSSQFKQSIGSIMDALPPAPVDAEKLATKRVHARTRWTRFATGMTGVILAAGMLWSSYRIGYAHGRSSARRSAVSVSMPDRPLPGNQPLLQLCSLIAPPAHPSPAPPTPLARERSSP
jgi:hypothetical protein